MTPIAHHQEHTRTRRANETTKDIHTRPDLAYLYWEISDARIALLQAIFDARDEEIRIKFVVISYKLQNCPSHHTAFNAFSNIVHTQIIAIHH